MGIFDGFQAPKMTDATVPNPDHSEAEISLIEPDENAKAEEKDQVEFESASEAMSVITMQKKRLRKFREEIRNKANKLARLYNAMQDDNKNGNSMSASTRVILMEEEIIGDSAADDAKEAAAESSPEEIADKGASEEELAKASLKAQYRVYKKIYATLKDI